ncbi:MAG: protein kinase [Gemmatimonadales bacterium]
MTAGPERLAAALADRYRIERELGRGGMAIVYLAQDLRHDRKVALKVLRPELAAAIGAERFLAEIRTTAALQHPHILPLFDSGAADGFLFYVMPFVQGETVRDRLQREKQLPVGEAVRIATEVAAALDYAHRHGVIHRDIKPENILLHDGSALVADFGIALAASTADGVRMTETGMSLGTPSYMSPEQAAGEREITARSDVYALGCVLYEMLLGEPPFTGPTIQATVAKVLGEKPAGIVARRERVPIEVEDAVLTALEKLPADRFASAGEFAAALQGQVAHSTTQYRRLTTVASRDGARWRRAALALAALTVVATAAAVRGWLRPAPEPVLRLSVPAPAGTTFLEHPEWPALSPDGATVVFAAESDGVSRLYRRPVNGFRTEAIEGSEGATYPFFSPDGAWVGFYTRSRQIKKVPLEGGQPIAVTEVPFWSSGAAWRHNGTIVVVSDSRGLYAVSDRGGVLAPLTTPDSAAGEYSHTAPQELGDGRLLFTVAAGRSDPKAYLAIMEAGTDQWRRLPEGGGGVYVEPGFLVSVTGGDRTAVRYDLSSGRVTGAPVPVLEGASLASGEGISVALNVNDRGDVAYYTFPKIRERYLVRVDRSGQATRVATEAGPYRHPRISPDGTRLAVTRRQEIWVLDLRSGAWTRLTRTPDFTEPQWSPDGRRILHSVFQQATGYAGLAWRNADGSGDQHLVHSAMGDDWPSDWSADGRRVAVYGGPVGMNVSVVELDDTATLHPVTQMSGTAVARNARFSPDGRWLAYQSNETGRMQVYVVSYPDLGQKRPVSADGGTEPAWKPGGGELFYRNGASLMAVTIRTSPTLDVGAPRELFRGPFEEDVYGDRSYDVMPDGQHFLMFQSDPASAPELRVVRNWGAEIAATANR